MPLRTRSRLLLATSFACFLSLGLPAALHARQVVAVTPLERGKNVERDAAAEADLFSITLAKGDALHLFFVRKGVDLALSVKAPDGGEAFADPGAGRAQGPKEFLLIVTAAGAYTIEVRPVTRARSAAGYTLRAEAAPATAQDEKEFVAESANLAAERLLAAKTAEGRRKAAAKYQEALSLWRDAGRTGEQVSVLINLGDIYNALGEFQKSLDAFSRAEEIARAAGDSEAEGQALGSLSLIYTTLGDAQKALYYGEQALPRVRASGNREDESAVLSNLGLIYSEQLHDKRKALELYDQSLSLIRGTGNRQKEAVTLNNIGRVYKDLGEPRRALEFYAQSLPLRREVGDRQGEAAVLNNMGAVFMALGDDAKALEHYRQAYGIAASLGFRKGEATTLYSIAFVLDKTGDLAGALAEMEKSVGIIESLRGELTGQEDRAAFLASTESYYKYHVDLLMRLHLSKPEAGYAAAALQASERAHARGLLEMLAEAKVNLRQDVDPALLEQERRLQQQINNKTRSKDAVLAGRHTDAEAAAAQKELEGLLAEYQKTETRIRVASPRYAALTRTRLLSAEEIEKRLLDPDTLLLEYSLAKTRSYLWVVSDDSVTGYALPAREQIEEAARRYYELLTARSRRVKFETAEERAARLARADAELPSAAAELSRMLLGPAAAKLGTKRLLVVTDGILHTVPFSALPSPVDSSRPLVLDHEIVSEPSASALAELRAGRGARRAPTKTVAVLADPVFDKSDARVGAVSAAGALVTAAKTPGAAAQTGAADPALTRAAVEAGVLGEGGIPRLPFTRREAQAIASLVPASERDEALDFDAARATATGGTLSEYRYVHFATHSFINSQHPELSGVVLSLVDRQGREQDGFLRAGEVFRLNLPAEMVTLSGCRTGLGKQMGGEGLVGLTQGFMYAGGARVLVSLWDVNDQATAELMGRLYKSVLAGRLTPAAALREAQLSVMRDARWRSPYYWAAFVLQGEPK